MTALEKKRLLYDVRQLGKEKRDGEEIKELTRINELELKVDRLNSKIDNQRAEIVYRDNRRDSWIGSLEGRIYRLRTLIFKKR